MAKVTGIVNIKVDGQLMRSEKGAKLNVGGMKREPIMAGGQLVGYQEEPAPATLEFKMPHTALTNAREVSDWTDKTLKFECDTGQSYLITNAFTTEPCEVDDGWVPVKMAGDVADKE